LERSFRYKDAGLRTLALVALGSCAFATAGYAVLSLPGLGQVLVPETGGEGKRSDATK
jgi:uncharacterized membrane protein YhiD involved in acid resistance